MKFPLMSATRNLNLERAYGKSNLIQGVGGWVKGADGDDDDDDR